VKRIFASKETRSTAEKKSDSDTLIYLRYKNEGLVKLMANFHFKGGVEYVDLNSQTFNPETEMTLQQAQTRALFDLIAVEKQWRELTSKPANAWILNDSDVSMEQMRRNVHQLRRALFKAEMQDFAVIRSINPVEESKPSATLPVQ